MKKHTLLSDIAVFLLIIFLFIVPPFFSQAVTQTKPLFSGWSFPWYQILLAFLSILILLFYYEKNDSRTLLVFPVLFTSGMLFSTSFFCRFLSEITGAFGGNLIVTKPEVLVQWLFCLLNFLCAAFFEEVIYRFYFIDQFFSLITRKKVWPLSRIICELTGLLCFAFAHLYMGWISVLNAAFAHIFLRLCYKKIGKLWSCVLSHFIYNVISLILL